MRNCTARSHKLTVDFCYFFRRGRGRCVQLSSRQEEPRSRGPRLSPGPSRERQTGRMASWELCGGLGSHGWRKEGGAPRPEHAPRPGKRDVAGKRSPAVVSSLGSFREERSESQEIPSQNYFGFSHGSDGNPGRGTFSDSGKDGAVCSDRLNAG